MNMEPTAPLPLHTEDAATAWMAEGNCRLYPPATFFPSDGVGVDKARKIWLYWKQTNSKSDDWLPPPDDQLDPAVKKYFKRPTGTVHASGLADTGDISCVTSTSGLAFKLPGRVGDSPIVGAGLYVDNEVGAATSTGVGEEVIRNCGSFLVVELMRQGRSPTAACQEAVRRIMARKAVRASDFQVGFLAINKAGEIGAWAVQKGFTYAVCNSTDQSALYDSQNFT